MLVVKHILCPIAGTEESDLVVDVAASTAEKFGAKLSIFYIAPIKTIDLIRPQVPLVSDDMFPDQLRERLEKYSEEVLEQAKKFVEGRSIEAEYSAIIGRPGPLICQTAAEGKYDLVVLGCRKHSLIEGMLLGSVSTYVVQNSPCPVLVVRGLGGLAGTSR